MRESSWSTHFVVPPVEPLLEREDGACNLEVRGAREVS